MGCVGDGAAPLYKFLNFITFGSGKYKPSGNPSNYGKTSSIEDFANSGASSILRTYGSGNTIPSDTERDLIIAGWINQAGK